MASCVYFKFKSALTSDTITFDGVFVSVTDLKRAIVDKKGLGRDSALELLLSNAQSGQGGPPSNISLFFSQTLRSSNARDMFCF